VFKLKHCKQMINASKRWVYRNEASCKPAMSGAAAELKAPNRLLKNQGKDVDMLDAMRIVV
jgi:hypothetical protein